MAFPFTVDRPKYVDYYKVILYTGHMYYKRLIEPTLKRALKTFPVALVTGPRQSGKTTLVRRVLGAAYHYALLDEWDQRIFAQQDPKGFLERHPTPVILDEIQNVPNLLSYIKARIEEDKRPGQWVLSGSQQFAMMKNISESLAGRVAVLHFPIPLADTAPLAGAEEPPSKRAGA